MSSTNSKSQGRTVVATIFLRGNKAELVHSDQAPIQGLGDWFIRRASHVEPLCNGDAECPKAQWTADLKPVGGPVLGPFYSRGQALKAEKEWLHRWLLRRTKETDRHFATL